jgi:hypothetical protein
VAVEDYKGLPREERKKRADEIYGKYFRPNSDYEVTNLPSWAASGHLVLVMER